MFGLAVDAEPEGSELKAGQIGERRVTTPILEHRSLRGGRIAVRADPNDRIRVGHGQGTQEEFVREREDRRVRRDPQREHGHRCRGESGSATQRPDAVAKVLNEGVRCHVGAPADLRRWPGNGSDFEIQNLENSRPDRTALTLCAIPDAVRSVPG